MLKIVSIDPEADISPFRNYPFEYKEKYKLKDILHDYDGPTLIIGSNMKLNVKKRVLQDILNKALMRSFDVLFLHKGEKLALDCVIFSSEGIIKLRENNYYHLNKYNFENIENKKLNIIFAKPNVMMPFDTEVDVSEDSPERMPIWNKSISPERVSPMKNSYIDVAPPLPQEDYYIESKDIPIDNAHSKGTENAQPKDEPKEMIHYSDVIVDNYEIEETNETKLRKIFSMIDVWSFVPYLVLFAFLTYVYI